ncbi:MAG: signal peptide peptidase SppA [Aureliella sp.]
MLARRLEKLKAAGKELYAWLENPSNVHLSVAASCDHVVLADFGGVDMPSSSMQSMFYRDAMEMFGVHASVVRAGEFKGAVEPFLHHQMSDHLRQHYTEMLSSINDAQVDRIARGRGLTVAQVRELQKTRLLLPEEALAKGLVDRLAPYGSMQETIDAMIGKSLEWTKPKAAPKREMSMFELMGRLMSGDKKSTTTTKDDAIAVLHLSGAIEDGKKQSPGAIVSGPIITTIEDLADDEMVKAVVVRINSPGGSATASEAIRRALAELAKKKPTVISMGEMAASGGYWISCIDQPVYAEKGTITGSIGVFSLKISMGALLRRIGVNVESIALDDAAKSDAIDRPWSERDMEVMQNFVDDVYGKFLKLVSKSRDLPLETLADLAGGRVWSGTQAKQYKLIDEIGGLDDCLAAVAKKAKLDKYEVIHRPVVKTGLDLLELLGEDDSSDIELRSLLSGPAFRAVARQGFDLGVINLLLRSAFERSAAVPQVWALCPNELRVR